MQTKKKIPYSNIFQALRVKKWLTDNKAKKKISKQSTPTFSEKRVFITPLMFLLRKTWRALLSCNTRFGIIPFAFHLFFSLSSTQQRHNNPFRKGVFQPLGGGVIPLWELSLLQITWWLTCPMEGELKNVSTCLIFELCNFKEYWYLNYATKLSISRKKKSQLTLKHLLLILQNGSLLENKLKQA